MTLKKINYKHLLNLKNTKILMNKKSNFSNKIKITEEKKEKIIDKLNIFSLCCGTICSINGFAYAYVGRLSYYDKKYPNNNNIYFFFDSLLEGIVCGWCGFLIGYTWICWIPIYTISHIYINNKN